jgi:hypothetical protein
MSFALGMILLAWHHSLNFAEAQVRNKSANPNQITAEQLLREAGVL